MPYLKLSIAGRDTVLSIAYIMIFKTTIPLFSKQRALMCMMLLSFLLTGCVHYYYYPGMHNVPLFKEKGESRATLALSEGEETSALEVQAAHSISDKYAAALNFMYASGGSGKDFGEGKYLEGAFGYYKPLAKSKVFEVFGGIGAGNQHHDYSIGVFGMNDVYKGFSELSFTKVFVQPSIGYSSNIFDVALSTRFSNLYFHKVNNQIDSGISDLVEVNKISQNRNSILFEPGITLRAGWKQAKLQLQFNTSTNLTHPQLKFEYYNLNIGLFIAIADRYGRKNPKY